MPQRDESDFEYKRRQIIAGALDVFASKGFEKATNKDIAAAAKIGSPGLIYHYFRDKADLFRQVVEQGAPALVQLLAQGDEIMDLPPREALERFARAFATTVDNRAAMAMLKLMLGEAARRPVVADVVNRVGPGRIIPLLSRYLSHQMDAGVLRRMDPGAAARCFAGSLLAFIITREVFPQPDSATLDAGTMAATAVDIFLDGMRVHEPSG